MLSFKQSIPVLSEETVRNKHLDHIEDLMILEGQQGLKLSIAFLKDIAESLKTGSTSLGLSTKWDGKPAIVCGINPDNGKFFVATKGAFSKTVSAFHTEAEIKKGISDSDLAFKLSECLKHLPKIGIKGVLQGDLMFTSQSKKTQSIDGKDYITFQPNTILYAISKDGEIGNAVSSAKIGIAFHTVYSGKSMEELSAVSFNFDSSTLKKSPDVWYTDPNIYDITPALLKPDEYSNLIKMIGECESKAKTVGPFLKTLLSNKDLIDYVLPYINATINGGLAQFSARGLKLNIETKLGKEIEKLKTPNGKQGKQEVMDKLIAFVDSYESQFNAMFDLHNGIAKCKEILLAKFYALSKFGHFFVDADGIRPTDPEGIVVARSGRVTKLVNRLRFSRQNRKVNA
jgi:hypothetical protein